MTTINFNNFRNEVEAALAAVAEKYGCEVTAGNIKYDNTSIDISLAFKAKGENGESAEEMDFRKLCGNYGFTPDDYNSVIITNGKGYRFVGFNTRARKNTCIIKDANGKTYTCAAEVIRMAKER
jgi:hypothetical protein